MLRCEEMVRTAFQQRQVSDPQICELLLELVRGPSNLSHSVSLHYDFLLSLAMQVCRAV